MSSGDNTSSKGSEHHDKSSAYKSLKNFSKKLKKHSKVTTDSDSDGGHHEHVFDFANALHHHGHKSEDRSVSTRHSLFSLRSKDTSKTGATDNAADASFSDVPVTASTENIAMGANDVDISGDPTKPVSSSAATQSTETDPSRISNTSDRSNSSLADDQDGNKAHGSHNKRHHSMLRFVNRRAGDIGNAALKAHGVAHDVANDAIDAGVGVVDAGVGVVGAGVNAVDILNLNASENPVSGARGPRIANTLTLMSDNPEQRARAAKILENVARLNAAGHNNDDTNSVEKDVGISDFEISKGEDKPSQDDDADSLDIKDDDVEIPEGSVPGLGYGTADPLLPGEKSKDEIDRESQEKATNDPKNRSKQQIKADIKKEGAGTGEKNETAAENEAKIAERGEEDREKAVAREKEKMRGKSGTSASVDSAQQQKRFKPQQELVSEHRKLQAGFVGWRQIGGWDPKGATSSDEQIEDIFSRSTLLENYISNKFIGDWYQNTAIILFTAIFAWLLGKYRFSFTWLFFLLMFTATTYRTSVRRMRRNYRDDIIREALIERSVDQDTETMEWLNSFLVKFWLIYEPSLSQMITGLGNEVLKDQTPGFIDSMMIQKFTLGTKAPRIDSIRSFPHTKAQVVIIDMSASFTPNDTFDLTARQLQTKINPKVQLGVRLGKGFLTKNFPILLEDMNFRGKFRVKFKLMNRFPHFQTMDFSFLEAPKFDFVLKPIGGDKLGFDINIIPGLSKFIKDIVNANLGPMLYAPNAFQVNIEQLMQNVGILTGVGVLSVEVISADNLVLSSDGRVDPYVVLKDRRLNTIGHTDIKSNAANPVWNEFLNTIVYNTNDNFLLEVFDFNDNLEDRSIGQVTLRIEDLLGVKERNVTIMNGGRPSGNLKFVGHYSEVHMPSTDDTSEGSSYRDTKSGILSVKISRARYLDPSINKTAKLSPYAEIEFNGKLIDSTKISKHSNDPEWNYSAEHIVTDKMSTLFVVRIKDHRSGNSSPTVGVFKLRMGQLLIECEKGNKWFSLEGGKGEICIETQWKPCNIRSCGNTANYIEPIGVVRLKVMSATNLRNLEHLGKIDPYTRVYVGNRLVARTNWFHNNLNPVWNETLYIPVQNELQTMTVEVMDVEKRAKDRSLGSFKINLSKVISQDDKGNFKVTISDKLFANNLMLPNRGPKGTLMYTLEFYPAIPIISPQVRESLEDDRKVIALLTKKIEENGGDIQKALSEKERTSMIAMEERIDFGGIDMPIEQQLTYSAGVFACSVVSLTGHRVGQSLRMIADNALYSFYASPVFKTSDPFVSNECADFVSAQMDLSSVRFEIGEFTSTETQLYENIARDSNEENKVIEHDKYASEITIPCRELIANATLSPKTYTMASGAKLRLQVRYFPLPALLVSPSEDISNDGVVEIALKRAVGVRSADSNGFSDPYTAFYLNNDSEKVYKSKTIKETLDPVWNESFRFSVKDYRNSTVKAVVMDWDMGNRDDFLGGYIFHLQDLVPLEWKDYEVDLENIRKKKEFSRSHEVKGKLFLSIRFNPGQIHKEGDKFMVGAGTVAKATGGIVSFAGGTAYGVANTGVGVGKDVVGAVGSIASKQQKLFRKMKNNSLDLEDQAQLESAMSKYQVNVTSITKFQGEAEIELRCFLILDGEKEVWRSSKININDEDTSIQEVFEFKSLPDAQLGVKLLGIKSFGRHSDLGQSATDINPGEKQVIMQNGSVVLLDVQVI